MKTKKKLSEWCTAPLVTSPLPYALFTSSEGFKAELHRLKAPDDEWLSRNEMGKVHTLNNVDGPVALLVCIRPTKNKKELHATLVHESVHIWQLIKEYLGEDEPSKEFEAYSIDGIYSALSNAYEQQTGKKQ